MASRAHPDCSSCQHWRPDEGEEMRVYVNGILMREGETRTVGTSARVEYVFVGTSEVSGGAGEAQEGSQ